MGQHDKWDYLTDFVNNNLEDFERKLNKKPYFVKIKKHPVRADLIMFNYHPFKSDFTNPIVRCSRGSVYILQDNGTIRPYLTPFFKFSSLGENGEDQIDWETPVLITEKLDGSFIKLLKEPDGNDLWTTNRGFELDVMIPKNYPVDTAETLRPPYTFNTLLELALQGYEIEISKLPKNWTFMFELTSPFNRIVLPYPTTRLWLLGGRDENHVERTAENIKELFGLTFDTPQKYLFSNLEEVIIFCDTNNRNSFEGLIIQDIHFNRIKVKSKHYENLQKMSVRSKSFIKKLNKLKI